jgi:hypothetical protein
MSTEEEKAHEGASGGPSSSPTNPNSGKQDLLMRFFESDFFDAWIAVTYVFLRLNNALFRYFRGHCLIERIS